MVGVQATLSGQGADMSEQGKRKLRAGAVWRAHDATLVQWSSIEVLITRPWPAPRAWSKAASEGAPWVECFGRVGMHAWFTPVGPKMPPDALAVRQAWETVPLDVRLAVKNAALRGEEWGMLTMLARCPGAMDLANSVPVLAGALAASRRFGAPVARPLRSARALLRRPDGMNRWRAIARWLELPHCCAFVNTLRRVPAAARLSVEDIRSLNALWAHPLGKKRLLHTAILSVDAIRLLAMAMERRVLDQIHPDLVGAAAKGGEWGGLASIFDTAVQMWQHTYPRSPLPAWRNAEQVEVASTELRNEFRRVRGLAVVEDYEFPPPPFAGDSGVTPLMSAEKLSAEGAVMGHCIGSQNWAQEARVRGGYAYHVGSGDDRATLWLRRDRNRALGFRIEQLKGPGNAEPTQGAVELVTRWISGLGSAPELPDVWLQTTPTSNRWDDIFGYSEPDDDIPF